MTEPPAPPPTDTRRFAAASLAAGDATGWFEELYASARDGDAVVPWDVAAASVHLREFPLPPGEGRRALVVGCGPGRDAEHLAALGYAVTAFDIAATAIELARSRHPESPVAYQVADLLDPPAAWTRAFDLVLESNNVQALPAGIRARAIAGVGEFVAPGGTLLVLAAAATDFPPPANAPAAPAVPPGTSGVGDGPPWPLTRAEVDAFAGPGLRPISVEEIGAPGTRLIRRWRAVFTR
ncbi:class I SAM-dependent methyltransferase [Actinoplanes awajinensis]|uniref:SAM-dependent methyltransferase n=1 Tax=Actinoplanes awajinensis subsp. mycoplanecinus TaxID=135947 RepID=A0A124GA35_9ACTN|nr:class I SAM-dependent methyltransferase [Actinoplanes awajinensis]KUL30985.1 SAM-dependent methyltransferase [Actinoplanes awajinensis subsp. mycoplanecinus]